jgi:hypothetical protein
LYTRNIYADILPVKRSRIPDISGIGGGFFPGSTHNLQADISAAEIVAMYEAAKDRAPE